MARIKRYDDFDWAGADACIQPALALEPGNPQYLLQAADSAAILGRFDEALRLGRQAVELDPLDSAGWGDLGQIRYFEGQRSGAEAHVKKFRELRPDAFPGPILLSQIYVMQGRPRDALTEIELVRSEAGREYLYAITYAALGQEKQSDAALSELIAKHHADYAYQIAQVYVFRKQSDEAFEWLDRAYAQRDSGLIGAKVDPILKTLNNEPRYAVLLKKLHLPT